MKQNNLFLLIILGAIWGASFIFMRASVMDFGAVFLVMIRVGLATLVLTTLVLTLNYWKTLKNNWRILATVGLFNSALPFSFLAYASLSVNAGVLAIINATTPFFTAIIAYFWFQGKLNFQQLFGLILCFFGVLILMWNKLFLSTDFYLINEYKNEWVPLTIGLFSSVAYGIAANITKKSLSDVSPMFATTGSLFFASCWLLVPSLFFLPDFSKISLLSWGYATTLSIVCTAFAYVLFFRLIQNIGATLSVSVTFFVPIFAFIWAYLLLDEEITTRMIVATCVVLFGAALVLQLLDFKKLKLF